jgi:RNA polymerase sigma-70 factor (ECF subfamily)
MNIIIKEELLNEGGLRNIRELANRYNKAKIYFHQDLDGVTTALAMKNYLENNGIKVIDAEVIQYGDKEFSIKKPSASGDVMPVLVDFAHGKPMFVIHTDHHDKQVGAEKGASTSFRASRSNVETISQIVSSSDIFPDNDIKMISTVDSADFVKMGVTPDDIMTYVFQLDKEKELSRNKIIMALVTNKLLLAYKNKPKFLERLVMNSSPSLLNIYFNIIKLAKEEGYVSPEIMKKNLEDYIEAQKKSENVEYIKDYGIISQYGGGALFKPGAYDRYVPFKNYPDANFLVIAWPLGLLQASCNPFKASRELKGVNLGEIAQEVLAQYESELKSKKITIDTIKYFAEKNKEFVEESVGFTFNDLVAMFEETDGGIEGLNTVPSGSSSDYTVDRWHNALRKVMDKPYSLLNDREKKALKLLSVTGWDMIQANSGGHKCITNISGLMYFGKDGKEFLLKFKDSLINKLKEKIDSDKISENIFTKKQILKEVNEFQDIYSSMWDKMLRSVCMKYTKDVNQAEDFCQNGFIKVYQNLNKYDNTGSLEGWVKRVINNSILDELRKNKISFVSGGDEGFDFSRYNVGDEEYEEGISLEDIKKVLPQLPQSYKKAIEMYYIEGLKHDEIAKKLGISPSTSKTNLMKAKARMKDLLSNTYNQ